MGMQPQGNGMAVAALVLGILALVLFFIWFLAPIMGLLAIIFGAVGISKANKIGGKGKGMAIAGLVCGVIGMLLSIVLVVIAVGVASRHSSRFGQIDAPQDQIIVVDQA
jgi:RsiW-degrading membrane proteinase PrsW (M82 family)